MKINRFLIGGILASVLATSCCWLPLLLAAMGGAAGWSAASGMMETYSLAFWSLAAVLMGISGWQFFRRKRRRTMSKTPVLQSLLTCPNCGFQKMETMPTDACMFFYPCEICGEMLRPKPGDCCVFCSYGSVKCPPKQTGLDCC